ncbi:uncharacterized protein BO96DRAFT_431680 [Aspergillus niger CBS 101883]|uniref:Uncharacterized protein n=2 Tax=Aspergillus niger TaxID=5061 RepID=A2QIE5_ASPNC|nr:uncharacterized protein BO96DRAFT_431680 [Aspergillus niger CBS 101883]XP_059603598.1 hypothetical protein An04g03230 [Aspergillus niger]PYH59536.1 hypothetical protein BO96DRAFT_431680 [Aspergillus niger CBS 101883]CAK44640.1 hypothetical protein An04g03230 [Aspergillus niger]
MEGKLSLDWRGCLNREGKSEILADYTRKSIREVLPLGRSKEVEGREEVGDVGNARGKASPSVSQPDPCIFTVPWSSARNATLRKWPLFLPRRHEAACPACLIGSPAFQRVLPIAPVTGWGMGITV